jgi:transposase
VVCGHNYGTIVVDLERREPIEVFIGRETDAVAAWMRANPSIEIVARTEPEPTRKPRRSRCRTPCKSAIAGIC